MTRDQALAILNAHSDAIRSRGIAHWSLFGSTARNEARSDSDVDVLIDLDPVRPPSALDEIGLPEFFASLLGCRVDVVRRDRIKPFLRERILAEADNPFTPPTPPRSPRQALQDMLDAIDRIEQLTAGNTLDDYRKDWVIRDAVERNVERLSEASRRLPDVFRAAHPTLPWRRIAEFGNVLRHAYDGVDDSVIWAVATEHLTPLRGAVLALLNEAKAGSAQG